MRRRIRRKPNLGSEVRRSTRRKPNLGLEMRRTRRKPISIPYDVIGEILALLPVKDLLRFRCVFKFFKSLIDSPDFIKLHLSHSKKTSTDLYGICEDFKIRNLMLFDLNKSINKVAVEMVDPPPGFYPNCDMWVMGSCNGLIALTSSRKYGDVTIWNPLTGKFKTLAISIPHHLLVVYGFGYDPKTDDYKLLKIITPLNDGSDSDWKIRVSVYSLKSNSWKEIGNDWSQSIKFYLEIIVWNLQNGRAVLANNSLHWLIKDGGLKIVAFDLIKEEFHFHDVPVLDLTGEDLDRKLSVLNGCLILSSYNRYNAHVWVMKEYYVQKSWTKLLCFNQLFDSGYWLRNGCVVPLAYSGDGAKLLLNHRGDFCDLFWYDLSTQKVKPCLYGKEVSRGGMIPFVGSLVALDLNEKPSHIDKRRTRGDTLKKQLSSR